MGLQGPFKEIEIKASGQDKNYQTLTIAPPISLSCPLPHLELPGLLLPAPYQEPYVATPHPAPIGPYMPPTNQQVYRKTPLSPTNQQVSRCILSPLHSPWAIKTDRIRCLGSALPKYQEVILMCQQHLLSQETTFFLHLAVPEHSFSNPHAQPHDTVWATQN